MHSKTYSISMQIYLPVRSVGDVVHVFLDYVDQDSILRNDFPNHFDYKSEMERR